MIEKPKRGRPAKAEAPSPDAVLEEPELPVVVDEDSPPLPSSATVTVNARCRWNSVQSAGMWFTKGQPVVVRLDDPNYPEWQANPFLIVEV